MMQEASHGMSRTFPPISDPHPPNPFTPRMVRTKGPGNQLNVIKTDPSLVDPRLTSQGTWGNRQIPAYVPLGYIDPRNVFSMRPA